jgi:hypothetical protein
VVPLLFFAVGLKMRPDMPKLDHSSRHLVAQGNVSRSNPVQQWENHLPKVLLLLKKRRDTYAKEKNITMIIFVKRVLRDGIRSPLLVTRAVLSLNMVKMQLDLMGKI